MRILLYLVIGLSVGSVSGALGIGGGVLLVPALIWLCGFEPRTAAGTTLAVLAVPVVLPAVWRYYTARLLDLEAAIWIAAAFAGGAYLGATLVVNQLISEEVLRLCFGLGMVYIALRMIVASDSEAANAAAGLIATVLAWCIYWILRQLGRHHLNRPDLGQEIRRMQEEGRGDQIGRAHV